MGGFLFKLHVFALVFITLDNSLAHMCLYVAADQIMLFPSNQTEWILVYY